MANKSAFVSILLFSSYMVGSTTEKNCELWCNHEVVRESAKIVAGSMVASTAFDFLNNAYSYFNFFIAGPLRATTLISSTKNLYKIGIPAGILLASAAQAGNWPKLPASELAKPAGIVCSGILISSIAAGYYGYKQYSRLVLGSQQEENNENCLLSSTFYSDLYARNMSYLSGSLGTISLIMAILRKRYKLHKTHVAQTRKKALHS